VAVLECRPCDADALEQAVLTRASFECAVEIGRQWTVNEAVLAEQWQRGWDAHAAACKAARGRLGVIDGALAGPH